VSADFTDILYSVTEGVARITINRPESLNSFTGHTMIEMSQAIDLAIADRSVGVLVLTGAGDRAFSSGGDIRWETAGNLQDFDFSLGLQVINCPKPVIARVNGYAIGGGNHLAYCCDLTIASENATFGQNGPRVGSPAGGYFVAHLAGVIGHKRAREMWMLCRRYNAQQALAWGLVNAVVPLDKLDAEVDRWCREILTLSPSVLKMVKASLRKTMEPYLNCNVSDLIREAAPDLLTNGEQAEGRDAFLEKRAPDFSAWR